MLLVMRWFLRRRIPPIERVLVVESGARAVAERVLPVLRATLGQDVTVDLVTCYLGLPAGWPDQTRVFRVADYAGRLGRKRLYAELGARGYSALGILCSGDPIMIKWKWSITARVPAKVFVINENADYLWLDRGHLGTLARLAATRTGFSGAGAVRATAQIAALPFAVAYLLLYAAWVHARRGLRMAFARRNGG